MRPVQVKNPPNRFSSTVVEYLPELAEVPEVGLEVYEDHTRSIIAQNTSPDVGFRWSVNPYRGCFHACAYCYARPTHEYLGFGTGVDFERRIAIKPRAPELLREAFERKSWKGELIVFSGNTDCYQPLEATYELTRRCLAVCAEYRNPVHLITKSPLIERDTDLLVDLSRRASLGVSISVPFWDEKNARAIEPYVATPSRRMTTVRRLSAAGIGVGVNVAPIIPGLSDRDIGPILEAAAAAGARSAAMILLRLPGSVKEVFEERLRERLPLVAERVLARTREVRGGRLNDPRFGTRMSGEGEYASAIHQLFEQTARRLGLSPGFGMRSEPRQTFQRPPPAKGQLELFGGQNLSRTEPNAG